jgi:anti-sigma factor RsiW
MTAPTAVPPIDCHAAVRQLWDFLDGELDAARVAAIAAHVEHCRSCSEHYAFARSFLAAVGEAQTTNRAADNAGDVSALRARVVAALRREGYDTPS